LASGSDLALRDWVEQARQRVRDRSACYVERFLSWDCVQFGPLAHVHRQANDVGLPVLGQRRKGRVVDDLGQCVARFVDQLEPRVAAELERVPANQRLAEAVDRVNRGKVEARERSLELVDE